MAHRSSDFEHVPFFRSMPSVERNALLDRATRLKFANGTFVYHAGQPGDSMYVLVAGRVGVVTGGERGEPVLINVLGRGDVFGELGMLQADHRRTGSIQAMSDIDTLLLLRSDVDDLRLQHPRVNDFLLQVLAQRLDRLTTMAGEFAELDAATRIHRQLVRLADVYEVDGPNAVIPVTQPQLASLSGAGLRITNSVIAESRAAGILTPGKRQITVLDWEGVRRKAGWRFK